MNVCSIDKTGRYFLKMGRPSCWVAKNDNWAGHGMEVINVAELANCEQCGKVFVKVARAICPTCYRENEQKFETVWHYIRQQKNREATVYQVHEATGVEEKLIFQWVREGRLKVKDFVNLAYPCQSCGAMIQSGMLCDACANQLKKEIAALSDEEDQDKFRTKTYHTR